MLRPRRRPQPYLGSGLLKDGNEPITFCATHCETLMYREAFDDTMRLEFSTFVAR